MSIKLAIRNLIGAGLRTWLNVFVLSFAFVIIVFYNGMLDGWNMQAHNDTKEWETGAGELWNPQYDPYDPYSLQDAHAKLSDKIKNLIQKDELTPVLITQASIYPQGRMLNILLKGIDPAQKIVKLPSALLQSKDTTVIPALAGKRMAADAGLKLNDRVLMRWRDKNGTFDAQEVKIVGIFDSNVPTIDNNQLWIPLKNLQEMTGMADETTLMIAGSNFNPSQKLDTWQFKDLKFLLKDLDEVIQAKKGGASVIYLLLLAIALLAIFDTQILSIFRRQKEIGTYIALGMTRTQVMKIFTVEGSAHSILAIGLAAIYGIPFLSYLHRMGIPVPKSTSSMGMAIAEKIIPVYSLGMVLTTIILVVASATIVSFFPARRILKMKPTDALKGKLQ